MTNVHLFLILNCSKQSNMKVKASSQENDIFYPVNMLLLVRAAPTLSIKISSIKGDGKIVDAI